MHPCIKAYHLFIYGLFNDAVSVYKHICDGVWEGGVRVEGKKKGGEMQNLLYRQPCIFLVSL
jgi:hypothetical protein